MPLDRVTVVMGDTAVVPYDQQTSASRSTVLMGNSVLRACRSVQAQLQTMAALVHGVAGPSPARARAARAAIREIPTWSARVR